MKQCIQSLIYWMSRSILLWQIKTVLEPSKIGKYYARAVDLTLLQFLMLDKLYQPHSILPTHLLGHFKTKKAFIIGVQKCFNMKL